MSETGIEESAFEQIIDVAGATKSGIEVSKAAIANGEDPIARASYAAKRGILSTAAEFICASDLDEKGKIDLLNKAAEDSMRALVGSPDPLKEQFARRATAVFQQTKELLVKNKTQPS